MSAALVLIAVSAVVVGGLFASTLLERHKGKLALEAAHDAFSDDASLALARLERARVSNTRAAGARCLEVTFPSSRHRSVVRARSEVTGALSIILIVPTRGAIPPMFRLRSIASAQLIHIGRELVTQNTIDLPSADMELQYSGHGMTAKLTDLMRALTPRLLDGLRAETSAHRARVGSLALTSVTFELGLTYPSSEVARLDELTTRLVQLGAHARFDSVTAAAFWSDLFEASPAGSAARLGALTNIMRHEPDSSEAILLHARVLEHEDIETLLTLYACSPHPFFTRMSAPRLHDFLGHQLSSGAITRDTIPETARSLLDARALVARALPGDLRMDVFERLDAPPEAMKGHAAALYSALSDLERADLFARTDTPALEHTRPTLIEAARSRGLIHIASTPALAEAFMRAVSDFAGSDTLAWDAPLEELLARLTLSHDRAAEAAADLLIACGGEHALRTLTSLNPPDMTGGAHAARAISALARRLGSDHLVGAMTLSTDAPDALRGALSQKGEAGALSVPEHEDAP